MKTLPIFPRNLMTAFAAFGIGFFLNASLCRADSPDDDAGTQVLTRGPVHEAFAAVISFKPQAGIVVPKAPPEIIEEVPPDQKPDGDNVTWIPGYWAWDDERNDFLWVSGVWRALPPGRQWVAGYWAKASGGYQWISGYWADADETQATYLPQPPATLENGPDVDAPADDDVWIPGCWIWVHGRYAWKPGYWIEGQADWDWSPDYYVWTPRGYVFVDGYWDYSIERRGVLFAPVYFESGIYAHPGYRYSPAIAIDLRNSSQPSFPCGRATTIITSGTTTTRATPARVFTPHSPSSPAAMGTIRFTRTSIGNTARIPNGKAASR